MFINKPQYSSPITSVAFNGSSTSDIENLNISPTGMFALKLYAFGGLAFMIGVILFSLGLWIWTIIIKREWANSPPELELHPERMREKERAREERLKRKKEEKQRDREKRREEKFTPPPIRLNQKARKSSFSSTSSTLRSPNRTSTPTPSITDRKPVERPRKSSLSVSPSKGLRVSWASSAATVDVDGHTSEKSIKAESKASSLPSIKFPFEDDTKSVVSSIMPMPIPRARNAIPRLSTSIEARAPQGDEMIATTTPDICESWSKPANSFLSCRCWDSVDPLDRKFPTCDIHRYKD